MIITSAKIDGFKNLKEIRIEPDEKYNIIIGKNAQMERNNTAVASAGGNAQKPEPTQAEDQNVSKGIRR